MTGLPIWKWSLFNLTGNLGVVLGLVDTAPAPDTISLEFFTTELPQMLDDFLSYGNEDLNIYEKTYQYEQDYDPIVLSLIDTAPAPDTILMEGFLGFEVPIIPFYPASQIKKPGQDLYAGDMGLYIG